MTGTAILVSDEQAQSWAQKYVPPVAGALDFFNLGSSAISSARRTKNWGSETNALVLAGGAALAAVGIENASTTVNSRCTMRATTPTSFTALGILDVGANAGVLRVADIRLVTTSDKKLKRIIPAGMATISTALPASGAVVYFVQGDTTGHRFGFITTDGVVSLSSTSVGDSTKPAYIGGSTESGQVAAAYKAYGATVYGSVLSDSDLLLIAERLYRYTAGFGVTVNG